MGTTSRSPRPIINARYEAACGDVDADDSVPVFLFTRADQRQVITGRDRIDGDTLSFTYRILDPTLDDDDVARIYVIASLERFAMHYHQSRTPNLVMRNELTGAERTTRYPDPMWLEYED